MEVAQTPHIGPAVRLFVGYKYHGVPIRSLLLPRGCFFLRKSAKFDFFCSRVALTSNSGIARRDRSFLLLALPCPSLPLRAELFYIFCSVIPEGLGQTGSIYIPGHPLTMPMRASSRRNVP